MSSVYIAVSYTKGNLYIVFANRDINYNPLAVVQNGCVFCRRLRDEMVYGVFFHSFVFASRSKYMPG